MRANGAIHRQSKTARRRSAGPRLRQKAMSIPHDLKQLAGITRDAAQERLENLRDDAAKYFEQGYEQVQQAEKSVAKFIREQPLKSVLIAAGLGCLIGRFWVRR